MAMLPVEHKGRRFLIPVFECLNFFCETVNGTGSTELKFNVPFEPDFLAIYGFDNRAEGGVACYIQDTNATGFYGGAVGVYVVNAAGDLIASMAGAKMSSLGDRYERAENGETLVHKLQYAKDAFGMFIKDKPYVVVATKKIATE